MSMNEETTIVEAARIEAQRMLASTATAPEDGRVHMSAAQFRTLANLLSSVAALAETAEAAEPDGFDAPIDGIRFWVPLPYLEEERNRHAADLALARRYIC